MVVVGVCQSQRLSGISLLICLLNLIKYLSLPRAKLALQKAFGSEVSLLM